MHISRRFILPLLVSLLVVTFVSGQNEDTREKEESNIPKKVLRKYRIVRPVIVDENGIAVTSAPSSPRLRRIRVNKPKPPAVVTLSPVQVQPSRTSLSNVVQTNVQQSISTPPPPFLQSIFEEQPQQVIEPVRVTPMYRKATPSSTRSALLANVHLKDRGGVDEDNKKQRIGTTLNYSRINEDGSFTFGYEGEDGSFKEETRGTDCVVRGKYGYVDPDGVRREFAYVSGNPCDPNDPAKDEITEEYEEPPLPQRTVISRPRRPVITLDVQQNLDQSGTEEPPTYQIQRRDRFPIQLRPSQEPTTYRPQVRLRNRALPTTKPFPTYQQLQGRSALSAFPTQAQPTLPQFPTPGTIVQDNRAFDFDAELQRIQGQQPQFVQQPQHQPYSRPLQLPQFQSRLSQFQPQTTLPPIVQPIPIRPEFGNRQANRQYFGGSNAATLLQQATPTASTFQQQNPTFQRQNPVLLQQPTRLLPQPITTNSIQEQRPVTNFGHYRPQVAFDPSTGRYTPIQETLNADNQLTLTQQPLRGFAQPQQLPFQPFGQQLQYYNPQQPQSPTQQQYQRPLFQNQFYQPSSRSLSALHDEAQEDIASSAAGQIDAFLSKLNAQT